MYPPDDPSCDSKDCQQNAMGSYAGIDHIAIAVKDLERAVSFFQAVLGFALTRRLEIRGQRTGMISAEMERDGLRFVLCQGTEPESQVCRLIDSYGPGVAHIALSVNDVYQASQDLAARGMKFDTRIIEGPGLTQIFSSRCANTGLVFEFIKRDNISGFLESNVQQLFDQLEATSTF